MGLGLTSRKNLCIHPEVRVEHSWVGSGSSGAFRVAPCIFLVTNSQSGPPRSLKRRRARLLTRGVVTSRALWRARRVVRTQDQSSSAIGMK
jgi:hypothetical protein